jgi:hypothetical protein
MTPDLREDSQRVDQRTGQTNETDEPIDRTTA